MINRNTYMQRAYQEYLEELSKNNYKLKSLTLSNLELNLLYNSKYCLTKFEIFLYIKSLDYLNSNNYNINLSEGLTDDSNKYKNILVDLFYQNISNEFIFKTSISNLFGIKYIDNKFINIYKSYIGNYNTYLTFKELIKIYLNNISLYYYNGKIYNELQLLDVYDLDNEYYKDYGSKWFVLSNLDPLITKLNYICLSIEDPKDIDNDSLAEIKIKFILQNLSTNYDSVSIVNFKLEDFWISKYK